MFLIFSCILVVIDYEKNKNANTGRFELLYQGKITAVRSKGLEQVSGKPLSTDFFYKPSEISHKISNDNMEMKNSNSIPEAAVCIKELGQGMRQTLEDLMDLLKNEKIRRQNQINRSIIAVLEKNSMNTQTPEYEIGSIELHEDLDAAASEELLVHEIKNQSPSELTNKGRENVKKQKRNVISLFKKITNMK